jgi:hypothetical protein
MIRIGNTGTTGCFFPTSIYGQTCGVTGATGQAVVLVDTSGKMYTNPTTSVSYPITYTGAWSTKKSSTILIRQFADCVVIAWPSFSSTAGQIDTNAVATTTTAIPFSALIPTFQQTTSAFVLNGTVAANSATTVGIMSISSTGFLSFGTGINGDSSLVGFSSTSANFVGWTAGSIVYFL